MIRKYLRQKIDDWNKRDTSKIVQIATDMNKQATITLTKQLPEDCQENLATLIFGKNSEFYSRVASIKRAEERSFIDNIGLYCYSLLDKFI